MEKPVKGDVIILPFPFSDLSASKKRPALVCATLYGDDLILCQITSEARFDAYSIPLEASDFIFGKLGLPSMIRPNRLFTADKSIICYQIGRLTKEKIKDVTEAIIKIVTA
jgi:mRNA interferase MazF